MSTTYGNGIQMEILKNWKKRLLAAVTFAFLSIKL